MLSFSCQIESININLFTAEWLNASHNSRLVELVMRRLRSISFILFSDRSTPGKIDEQQPQYPRPELKATNLWLRRHHLLNVPICGRRCCKPLVLYALLERVVFKGLQSRDGKPVVQLDQRPDPVAVVTKRDNTADCRTHEVVAHAHTAVAPLRGLDEPPATLARLHIAYTAYARPVREHLPHVNNAVRLDQTA
jgi:hypothetical protein